MSQFTTALIVHPIEFAPVSLLERITNHQYRYEKERPVRWILDEVFAYHVGTYPSLEIINVPLNFITDFASVPKQFWFILPPDGKYGKAAVLHDYMYRTGMYTRLRSDEIFKEAMIVLKVKDWQINTIYSAVRALGAPTWNKYRKASM